MKKIFAITLALVTLTLCFSACGQKAIEINPFLPDTYEIVIVDHNTHGTSELVYGRDAEGNKYSYDHNGKECVYLLKDDGESYDEYAVNEETGKYELMGEAISTGDAYLKSCYNAAHDASVQGSAEKIDALNLPDEISQKDLIFMDTERFEYYKAQGVYGGLFEAAVEKETGICFYACYEGGDYYYISEYTVPYEGNYASLITADAQ